MTVTPIPPGGSECEEDARISEQDLASMAGGQQIPDEQIAIWLAMLRDPNTPEDVRKRINARVIGLPVDGKNYDGSTAT